MALIKSQLVLTDGMTGPLKSINKAMNMDLYFKKLFGFHPNNKIEWRKALCT